ncbi:hypothetical protein C8R45DRAFT_1224093, partial [Mycena sanguinolenta]
MCVGGRLRVSGCRGEWPKTNIRPRRLPRLRIRPHRFSPAPHLPSHPTRLLALCGHRRPSDSTPRYGSVANARLATACTATQDPLPLSMSAFAYAAHDAHTGQMRAVLLPSLVKRVLVEYCHCATTAATAGAGGAATDTVKLALAVVVTVVVTQVGEESASGAEEKEACARWQYHRVS